MKKIFKFILRLFKWIFFLIAIVLIIGLVFLNTSPEFGGDHSAEDIERYKTTGHYVDAEEEFVNYHPAELGFSFDTMLAITKEYFSDDLNNVPKEEIPVLKQDSLNLVKTKAEAKLIWFGHSAFLLQLDGKNILLDPMFGEVPSPIDFMAKGRFFKELPLAIEKLPQIDFVFISHDHYDHLDYESIQKLKAKTKAFILPIGVGAHFRSWDVEESKIHEYNWWDEDSIDGLNFAFTPSRHFSGRGILDRNATLWGSWVIEGKDQKLFFSGDGGYDDHFEKIGEKFGPFNVAMVECGQYNKRWKDIHMAPEESAQAVKDLNAVVGIPIHWGGFSLSLHDWNEPPVRIKKAADLLGVKVVTPQIGETMKLDSVTVGYNPWWESIK